MLELFEIGAKCKWMKPVMLRDRAFFYFNNMMPYASKAI